MASIAFQGLEEYHAELEKIYTDIPRIVNGALYDGANDLANAVHDEISGLTELNAVQRLGLHRGLGIAHFWNEKGTMVTKIGFIGYNDLKTKRWPSGQPNAMIARSLIRGTSWMLANRFTARAARKARKSCIQTMQNRIDAEIKKITNTY